ncbi:Hypoxic response protein 1 [Fundidesulfovibrio magnetotacticus]|uniref:Hypoxic response protein 1 n=1 Tax=Fundidesulfovibrio magnetotacticus TaxID=2730080 RepID=A0A6V8LWL9_9BACT|nr:DUF190 domain-containing protein [Fundidesulfovibrio magnetotacticus]GFK94206.1 Hypoxic response protein 1 [Fundidesulfovibrio magnetotacticus]
MHQQVAARVLRVYLSESAKSGSGPLYERLVKEANARGMAGATVLRGAMGFGAGSLVHSARVLRLAEDLPVVVEIVDTPARMEAFLPVVDELVEEGLVLLEDARAVFHMPLRVRDVMSSDVACVPPDTPVSRVMELLLERGVKAVPVVEEGRVAGIVTGGDLLARAGMALRLDVRACLPADQPGVCGLEDSSLTAREVMSAPAEVLDVRASVKEAVARMAAKGLKRLPVVDAGGRLAGIVSRADVLAAVGRASAVSTALPALPPGVAATAAEAMVRDVPTASPETPLAQGLELMLSTPLRRVVVLDHDRRVLGMLLDREMVERFARAGHPGLLARLAEALSGRSAPARDALEGTVGQAMTREVFTVAPDAPLDEVVRLLVERGVKRLVVAGRDGEFLGMVDRDQVLRRLACSGGAAPVAGPSGLSSER